LNSFPTEGSEGHITLLYGRPNRTAVIDDLDIAYLRHQLETTTDLDTFIKNT
jgi:hypothetical protein